MALNKITYDNKVSLNPQPSTPNINKVSDADMNEIKSVVNGGIDALNETLKNLWTGEKYTKHDTLTISEVLQAGHLYMITCRGVSSSFTVSLPVLYTGGNIQIAYANVAGGTSEGFRYRLLVNGTTITIDGNSQNNISNTAILRIDKII